VRGDLTMSYGLLIIKIIIISKRQIGVWRGNCSAEKLMLNRYI